ncbi:HpcH/HpaI aldolase family protein [Pseudomonas fluorescens]|uniref:HpcH/HpaI aldolase family protein n=1 Tax=Pseudomonas fluorescens TaxID=294 RepID=UPI001254AC03|nr:aldolase/citrate lyase family protein [Pseudomonas fluorescens]VVN69508.1 5-keto-4-deoxy-D-glucarate aldolase [Pseudomonas fluorescens]
MNSNLKQRVQAKQPIAGCFISIPHPASVEACAVSGIDFICIDAEHSAVGRETLENMIRAAECAQLPSLVRVPDAKSGWIGWALDSGADGIIVPRVETEEDAQLIVNAAYYSPLGSRGVGIARGSSYGASLLSDTERAHDRTCVIVQIETLEGVRNAQKIISVPGIDAVFIGPFDLGLSLRVVPEHERPTLESTILSIRQICEASGVNVGIFIPTAADVIKFAEFPLKIIGTDVMHLQQGLKSICVALSAVD